MKYLRNLAVLIAACLGAPLASAATPYIIDINGFSTYPVPFHYSGWTGLSRAEFFFLWTDGTTGTLAQSNLLDFYAYFDWAAATSTGPTTSEMIANGGTVTCTNGCGLTVGVDQQMSFGFGPASFTPATLKFNTGLATEIDIVAAGCTTSSCTTTIPAYIAAPAAGVTRNVPWVDRETVGRIFPTPSGLGSSILEASDTVAATGSQ